MTTYKEAGVDIENTDALVEDISELSKSTNRNGNFDKIGGFGGILILKIVDMKILYWSLEQMA